VSEELHSISWARAGVSPRAIIGRHSKRHWFVEGEERTLCGVLIPWLAVHGSHEDDCTRCRATARRRGLELP
jgi:hypothetical protein